MTVAHQTADDRNAYLLRLMFTEGQDAAYRAAILTVRPARRLSMLTHSIWWSELLAVFPEGLPDSWLKEAVDADWATWYREGRR